MNTIIKHIAQLNLVRTLWHKLSYKYSDKECYDVFVAAMNDQAKEWGMNYTHWINPSGLGEDGVYSYTTANNMSLMAIHAFAGGGGNFHNLKRYELTIRKPSIIPGHRWKKKMVYATTKIDSMGNSFPIIGSKTGSGDGYQTLVMVCDIKGMNVAGAIMNADDEQGRFDAMDELMRIGYKILHEDEEAKNLSVTKARNASLCIIDEKGESKHIFAQNADEESAPMSTTKVMTKYLAGLYIKDYNMQEYIMPYDTRNTHNDILREWDRLSIKDMMVAMMLQSSNVAANAIARIAGREILQINKDQ